MELFLNKTDEDGICHDLRPPVGYTSELWAQVVRNDLGTKAKHSRTYQRDYVATFNELPELR